MEGIDQQKEPVGFNHRGKRSLSSPKGQVASIFPMMLILCFMAFAVLQWLAYNQSWFWDTNSQQTKRYPTLNRRVAFLKNPQLNNDITLAKNPNIDMIPMLWQCIHSVENNGVQGEIGGEHNWSHFLKRVFGHQKKMFELIYTRSIYTQPMVQQFAFTDQFGEFQRDFFPGEDPTNLSHMVGSGINRKICWPTEFTKDKEKGTWGLNTNEITTPVFKGEFKDKTVFASLRFSIQPCDNENVVKILCKVLTSSKQKKWDNQNICQNHYKCDNNGEQARKPKSNRLGWDLVRLSQLPSQVVQMDQFAKNQFNASPLEHGKQVSSSPFDLWISQSDKWRKVYYYKAQEHMCKFGTGRIMGVGQTQQPQNVTLFQSGSDFQERITDENDIPTEGQILERIENQEIGAADVQISAIQPTYGRYPYTLLDCLDEIGGQAGVFIALIFLFASCCWTPYFCNKNIYRDLQHQRISNKEEPYKHLKMTDKENIKKEQVEIKTLNEIIRARDKNLIGDTPLKKQGTLGILTTWEKAPERNLTDLCYAKETDIEHYIKRNRLVDMFFKYIYGEKYYNDLMFCKKPSKILKKNQPELHQKYKDKQELFMYDIDVTTKKERDDQPQIKMHGEKDLIEKLDLRLKNLQQSKKSPYDEKYQYKDEDTKKYFDEKALPYLEKPVERIQFKDVLKEKKKL